ncbi:acetyl-CoA hydrolase/transferase C-terminal domain-containing protein [Promethearchaeum syntrophicum]|uniref:Acetyl-CoA hydrolase/transferase C-terminal domain-containing protein n=1 Tax=Promethearchaeum syntrophicum TaxID=2594042 RepID=A0A5B9DF19_9ARCH|nr:acetyl-CoA hydrolase/transferase C-terminal domain-containing protein [Candidatus Prometheoarchaeum syntrophicum]QEE17383.1 hypothetical protein DSAG12_03217 [Candidatus Prometheoarchaeum syntrophicum]
MTKYFDDVEEAVDALIKKVGNRISIVMDVGNGKLNHYINALINRGKKDPNLDISIISALPPEVPSGKSDLEKRFYKLLAKRIWKDYPTHEYFKLVRNKTLPSNIHIYEMYVKSGAILNEPKMQQNYCNFHYTLIARDLLVRGVNVAAGLFAKRIMDDGEIIISGGSNTGLVFDVANTLRKLGKEGEKTAVIGEITSGMPFMYGDETKNQEDLIEFMLDAPKYDFNLFSVPKPSVSMINHIIGFYSSTLLKDGGTIQIGIGAMADGIVNSIIMRHDRNEEYKEILNKIGIMDNFGEVISKWGGTGTFKEGFHANSEMLVEPFLTMLKKKILKRKIYDHWGIQSLVNDKKIKDEILPNNILELLLGLGAIQKVLTQEDFDNLQYYGIFKEGLAYTEYDLLNNDKKYSTDLRDKSNLDLIQKECVGKELKNGYIVGASFFLGSSEFYNNLIAMDEEERKLIRMNSVLKINQLYGGEKLRRLQRIESRFFNSGMYVTLLGAVASYQLEDGRVVSGIGGQFNFVNMAQELHNGRSIICCSSTRGSGKKTKSNIKFSYGHTSIPRYLKDIVVTEYGIADLRGTSDEDCIKEMLNITDSRFQESLLKEAKKAKKINNDYKIPEKFKNNTPKGLVDKFSSFSERGLFKTFPFGHDFNEDELSIAVALKTVKNHAEAHKLDIIKTLIKSPNSRTIEKAHHYLELLELENPETSHDKISQKLLLKGLKLTGKI